MRHEIRVVQLCVGFTSLKCVWFCRFSLFTYLIDQTDLLQRRLRSLGNQKEKEREENASETTPTSPEDILAQLRASTAELASINQKLIASIFILREATKLQTNTQMRMQTGQTQHYPTSRRWWRKRCFICGEKSHLAQDCRLPHNK